MEGREISRKRGSGYSVCHDFDKISLVTFFLGKKVTPARIVRYDVRFFTDNCFLSHFPPPEMQVCPFRAFSDSLLTERFTTVGKPCEFIFLRSLEKQNKTYADNS